MERRAQRRRRREQDLDPKAQRGREPSRPEGPVPATTRDRMESEEGNPTRAAAELPEVAA